LRTDLPRDFFEDLQYAIFGLGDSSYEKFCWPAKKLSRRLEYLGAKAICPRAEGDTQHTLGYALCRTTQCLLNIVQNRWRIRTLGF
jgi:sulfite reductase alpha subunit-like flavoprotein